MRVLPVLAALPFATLVACSQPAPDRTSAAPVQAEATLRTAEGQSAGRATLTDNGAGVSMKIEAAGLTPGPHGFHIHLNGACAPGPDAATGKTVAFGAAGGHFDPGASKHHGAPGGTPTANHAGDQPNLVADAGGRASLEYTNPNVTLSPGQGSVLGRALVVHADPDDYKTDPAGNSGPRVLCGVIEEKAR
jgi:Cu-Zn family superoxide dismutase